ncbi:MAG: ATPase, T2SS/T4P/T4SS family [Elusimicrobiota bacterium]
MPLEPMRKKKSITDILLEWGLLTPDHITYAQGEAQKTKEDIGLVLIRLGYIKEEDYYNALAEQYGTTYIKLPDVKIDEELLKSVPEKMVGKFLMLPIVKHNNNLTVAMSNPGNFMAIDEIEVFTNCKVSVVLATEKDIKESIAKYYTGYTGLSGLEEQAGTVEVSSGEEDIKDDSLDDGKEYNAEDAPVVKYVNSLMLEAIRKKASDIHIEPQENEMILRLRLDGKLYNIAPPPKKFFSAIISRIKIMASLDIAERRLPQDGKCKVKIGNKGIDVRVSTLPTNYGEKVVMRILDKSSVSLQLTDLGFTEKEMGIYTGVLAKPHGMILVVGPTGSGKTTSLYAGINRINEPERNIITVEDPIEYEMKRINQVRVRSDIGLTFAAVLRSILRQDPDVIMIGEIRDKETAEIAIQAALTGHLVLSTLHTNDSVSTLSRLKYMGIEPYLIADAMDLIIAQRLVRRICKNCKIEEDVPENIQQSLGEHKLGTIMFYHGKGCNNCNGTGYQGRIAIYEMLRITLPIKKMIVTGVNDIEIEEQARKEGLRSLRDMAIMKLAQGITTIEEVLRVTSIKELE